MAAKRRAKQRPAVGILGKEITRRSRGQCELCGSRSKTRLFELEPFPEDPDPDRTLMTCTNCRHRLDRGRSRFTEVKFLTAVVWSQEPAVRLAAARIILSCADRDDPAARDAIEVAGVDPETGEFRRLAS